MKFIRDFFYNQNDLIITLLIICLAGSVIYGKMNTILDYPAQVAAEMATAEKNAAEKAEEEKKAEEQAAKEKEEEEARKRAEEEAQKQQEAGEEGTETGDESETGDNPGGGAYSEADWVTITVEKGSSWRGVGKQLEEAGVITDGNEFYNAAIRKGDDLGTLHTGTFQVPKGETLDNLILVFNGTKKY